jgi:hypothetical protein
MRSPEGLQVARDAVAAIETRGMCTDVELCTLQGAVGGRTSNTMTVGTFHAVSYRNDADRECFMLWPGDEVRDVERSLFIVDGVGMYVAGWQGSAALPPGKRTDDGYVILHPMHPGQQLLPRRAYVLCTV